jgi:LacI family transcriptional regulator
MNKRKITIQDIADELGVTASTVSRALQNNPRISDTTIKSVHRVANELNYKPNHIASSLRKGKSNIVGIIIPRANRNIFASVIKGVDEVVHKSNYKVLISQSNESTLKEKSSINTLLEARVDGILTSFALETQEFSHYKEIINSGIPLVLFDRLHEDLKKLQADSVVIDDYLGAFKATEHLIDQGCKRIVHFSGPQYVTLYKERKGGYMEALKQHNLPIDEDLILESDVRLQAGRELAEQIANWDKLPDAIFSASDFAAATAMEVLREQGIKIPEDIAVVGFANEPFTSFIKLTSVDQHAEEMGQVAAQLFLDQVNENTTRTKHKTVLNPDLIIRESSMKKE